MQLHFNAHLCLVSRTTRTTTTDTRHAPWRTTTCCRGFEWSQSPLCTTYRCLAWCWPQGSLSAHAGRQTDEQLPACITIIVPVQVPCHDLSLGSLPTSRVTFGRLSCQLRISTWRGFRLFTSSRLCKQVYKSQTLPVLSLNVHHAVQSPAQDIRQSKSPPVRICQSVSLTDPPEIRPEPLRTAAEVVLTRVHFCSARYRRRNQ